MSFLEDLYLKYNSLRQALDRNSDLYRKVSSVFGTFWPHAKATTPFEPVSQLYLSLNTSETIAALNNVKQRVALEEINKNLMELAYDYFITRYQYIPRRRSKKDDQNNSSRFQIGLFIAIAILGTIFAAVDGISIIQSLVSAVTTLSSIPAIILIPVQIAFAGIAALSFYALELDGVGKTLGLGIFSVNKAFKLYREQINLFHDSFELIQNSLSNPMLNQADYQNLKSHHTQMQGMYQILHNKIEEAKQANMAPSTTKNIVKKCATVLGAVVWGTLGGLAAQASLPTILPLIMGTAAATGPVGIGITLGLIGLCFIAAAGVYLYIEAHKKSMDKFINNAWGMPAKTIKELSEKDKNIASMEQNIQNIMLDKEQKFALEQENQQLKRQLARREEALPAATREPIQPFNSPERRQDISLTNNPYLYDFYASHYQPEQPLPLLPTTLIYT